VRDAGDGLRDVEAERRDAAAVDRRLRAAREQRQVRERIGLGVVASLQSDQVSRDPRLQQLLLDYEVLSAAYEQLRADFLGFLEEARVQLEQAASDRRESRRDRANAAHSRDEAAQDRRAAQADRFHAESVAAQDEINRNQTHEPV
jgi:hypothetical protein